MVVLGNNRQTITFIYIFLIIALSAFVTFINLGWQKNFIGEDAGVSHIFPNTYSQMIYYLWSSFTAPGRASTLSTILFLWVNFIFLVFKLGFNPLLIQRLVYFLFFSVSGLGVFFLLTLLLKKYENLQNNKIYFGAFVGSLLYMFNHFTMQIVSFPITAYHLSYMLLPLIFALFFYNLQVKTSFARSLLFSIVFLFLLGGNPANTVSIVLFLLFCLIFFRKEVKRGPSKPWRFLVTSFILILLLSSYIFLPIISTWSNPYGEVGSLDAWLRSLTFNSQLTSFLNLFRTGGTNIWFRFPYYDIYKSNFLFIFLGYALSILALASLLIPRANKAKTFFGVVVVFSLFFAKGAHPPFEKLFLFLFTHLPYFGMFRAVYYKFVYFIVLSYAVLIGFLASSSLSFFKKHSGYFKHFIFLLPFLICLYNWPFFTNNIIKGPHQDFLTIVPEEYQHIRETVKKDSADFKILSAPPSPKGAALLLKWPGDNKYVGLHPDMFFLDNPVLNAYWFIDNGFEDLEVGDSWGGTRFEAHFASVLPLTGILNLKYIFLHQDLIEQYDFGTGTINLDSKLKSETIKSILGKQAGIEVAKNTDYFTLYKLSDKYFLPHFYIPEKLIYGDDKVNTVFDLASFADYPARPGVFLSNAKDKDQEAKFLERADETFIKGLEKESGFNQVAYEFVIPKEGNYEIYLKKEGVKILPDVWQEAKSWEIKVDGEAIDLETAETRENGWIDLGEKALSAKKHQLIIHFSAPENLVGNDWQRSEKVVVSGTQDLVFQEINNWQGDNTYYLAFDYQVESGKLGVAVLESRAHYLKKEEVLKLAEAFESFAGKKKEVPWQSFEAIIKAEETSFGNKSLGAKIYFFTLADSQGPARVSFKNLKIYKIIHPKLVLRNTGLQNSGFKNQVPKITFVKINPVKYKVKVEGVKEPYILVFSEGFDKGWKAYVKNYELGSMNYESDGEIMASYFDGEIKEGEHKNIFFDKNTFETLGKKTIPEERHLLINGYANAWEIKPEDSDHQESYELIIEFLPQRFFYLGLFISGTAFIGSSLYLLLTAFKRLCQ